MFRSPVPGIFVSPQIHAEDLAAAASLGVVRVINNRPDGEEPGQPTAEDIRAAAVALGMDYHHIPMRGMPDAATIAGVGDALSDDGPTLLFCKSGMRSVVAWGLAQHARGAMTRDEIVSGAAAAGYDLSGLPIND